ncbi:hypothetical protein D3C73_937450 [compost metagenome]
MLRHQKQRGNPDAYEIHPAQIAPEVQEEQQQHHDEMQPFRDAQGVLQPEEAGNGP